MSTDSLRPHDNSRSLAGPETWDMLRVGGIVLCGGRSRRMGQPKAWLPFAGEPMLARVVRIVGSVVAPVVVVAAPGQNLPPLPAEVPVVRDPLEDQGPLLGFAAGLRALAGRADAAFLSSCDVPLLQPAFITRLVALLGDRAVCVPEADDRLQPLTAVYRLDVLDTVDHLLASGRRRMLDLLAVVPTRTVSPAELVDVDPTLASLRNLNTPADLAAAHNAIERDKGDERKQTP